MTDDGLARGTDGVMRCRWGDSTPDYRVYHDSEWGLPVADDVRLFEKLSLEGFQAGLSWLTILPPVRDSGCPMDQSPPGKLTRGIHLTTRAPSFP